MSRRLKQAYRCEPLRELVRQLRFAPAKRRVTQVQQAERLHDAIDPARTYPFEFLVYRLTGYRPDSDASDGGSLLLVGEAIQPDLRLMIDELSRAVALPADADDPVETVDQLAERLQVSTRTIARWRREGLRWRWMALAESERKQIVIPRSALDHFQGVHAVRIERARQFTHVEPADREGIVRRARRLAEAGDVSFNQVARHLARRTGRALETIRLILDKHDRAHPNDPIFGDRTGPLTPRQRRVIVRAHRWGLPVSRLTRRFGRTRTTIYRIIHQHRAADARRRVLSYVPSPTFDRPDADAVILRHDLATETRGLSQSAAIPTVGDDLPERLRPLFAHPPLPARRSRSLFIRYNYLKCKASRIRDALDRNEPRGSDLDAFDRCVAEAEQLHALLVRAHHPVVLSVARRHLMGTPHASEVGLIEMLQAGLRVLAEAVVQFNPARSSTFDSYLTNRLLQHFAAGRGDGTRARRRRSLDDAAETVRQTAAAAATLAAIAPASPVADDHTDLAARTSDGKLSNTA